MIDIVVVGYPKSGNTWVTRLVAELVECPVIGFFKSTKYEIAEEGLDRHSNYRCFKSHHQLDELIQAKNREPKTTAMKVIYVVRDPRDVSISGARYFKNIDKFPLLPRAAALIPFGTQMYHKWVRSILTSPAFCLEQMINATLFGSEQVNFWVRVPWATHYKAFLAQDFFFVRYEDLLSSPERECRRILDFLDIEKSDTQIRQAVEKQSFANKKAEFQKLGNINKVQFMKVGQKEQWRHKLSQAQKDLFKEKLAAELEQLGYAID